MARTCKIKGPHCLGDGSNQWRKISSTDWACNVCWTEQKKESRKKTAPAIPPVDPTAVEVVPNPALVPAVDAAEALTTAIKAVVEKKKRGPKKKVKEEPPKVEEPEPEKEVVEEVPVAPEPLPYVRVDSLEGDKLCTGPCGETKPKVKFGLRTMMRKEGLVRVLQARCSTCRGIKKEAVV
jgi:hypothetical protein